MAVVTVPMAPRKHRTRSLWRFLLPLLIVAVYLGGGCTQLRDSLGRWVDRTFGQATPREAYHWSRPFAEDVMARWDTAYARALRDTLYVTLPHREDFGGDTSLLSSAFALRFHLPAGRELVVQAADTLAPLPFGELYRVPPDRTEPHRIGSWDTLAGVFAYETERPAGEELMLLVQRRPFDTSRFSTTLYTRPVIGFPVAGHDDGSIRSFWGAQRDGGRRSHEGNDIFAARGTPLLAVTDGRVSRVRNGGLGGKTVWLRDGNRRLSYYYAHLDSQLVRPGQYVNRGDTVGLVGNTGNARTTPPHLHFGIYANGARDPFPYLRGVDEPAEAPRSLPGQRTTVPTRGAHYLRTSPSRDGAVIRQLEGGEAIRDLATTGVFHRIRTLRGETGYVNFD